jgi:hypothetical protein
MTIPDQAVVRNDSGETADLTHQLMSSVRPSKTRLGAAEGDSHTLTATADTAPPEIPDADWDRLAEALCRLLLSWWQNTQSAADASSHTTHPLAA